jgi:hypothetical protein
LWPVCKFDRDFDTKTALVVARYAEQFLRGSQKSYPGISEFFGERKKVILHAKVGGHLGYSLHCLLRNLGILWIALCHRQIAHFTSNARV